MPHVARPLRRLLPWTVAALALTAALVNLAEAVATATGPRFPTGLAPVLASAQPLSAGHPWDWIAGLGLLVLVPGLARRRAAAWTAVVGGLTAWIALGLLHAEPLHELLPAATAAAAAAVSRRTLVQTSGAELLAAETDASPDRLARVAGVIERHGEDSLDPFKARLDVAHLFAADDDAVLAFRVDNGALVVAGDPVGTPCGRAAVLARARHLAKAAGLAFGVEGASGSTRAALAADGLHSIYMGCEAVLDPATVTIDRPGWKKVRQAVRRIERAGFSLDAVDAAGLAEDELDELRSCFDASRGEDVEQSFAMAPEPPSSGSLHGIVVRARDAATGRVAGALVMAEVPARRCWTLALQARRPDAPNGVIDALVVAACGAARERQITRVSLNFATGRRYLHEPVEGFWPRVARQLARLARRWTQIDTLRAHNEKFRPEWVPRYLVADRQRQIPRVAFAAVWQEGQLPRPSALLAPAWPQQPRRGRPERGSSPAHVGAGGSAARRPDHHQRIGI